MVKRKRESTGVDAAADSGAKNIDENPDQNPSSSSSLRDRKRRKLSSTRSSDPVSMIVCKMYIYFVDKLSCFAVLKFPCSMTF